MLSKSFLDGLVSKLAESHLLGRVVFVTGEAEVLAKLGRIAAQRNLTLFFRNRVGDPKQRAVTPVRDDPIEVHPIRREFGYELVRAAFFLKGNLSPACILPLGLGVRELDRLVLRNPLVGRASGPVVDPGCAGLPLTSPW